MKFIDEEMIEDEIIILKQNYLITKGSEDMISEKLYSIYNLLFKSIDTKAILLKEIFTS
jgi:hypothetical protein